MKCPLFWPGAGGARRHLWRCRMLFPPSALERAMKVKEVIFRAISGEYTWLQAAEILGMSPRSVRRWRYRMERHGYSGLIDMRRGVPSPRRAPVEEMERILGLYRDTYRGYNARHFYQTVKREHGVRLSYSYVRQLLQGAGLMKKGRARGRHRTRRPRRPRFGEMLHLDGSRHALAGAGAGGEADADPGRGRCDVAAVVRAAVACRDDACGDDGDAGRGARARHPGVVLHGPCGLGIRHAEGWGQGQRDEPDPGR